MKKGRLSILPIVGLLSVLLFYVSATASIGESTALAPALLPELVNMLLLGIGLIGFSSLIKKKLFRE